LSAVFADTSYYIALLHIGDEYHAQARSYTEGFDGRMVTTAWIITETGNALAKGANRRSFVTLLADLENDDRVQIVAPTQSLFQKGLDLYRSRMDKDWSLTDCTSFVVMQETGLTQALTADRHFEQAGFSVLLA
jgi:hypothetical protein